MVTLARPLDRLAARGMGSLCESGPGETRRAIERVFHRPSVAYHRGAVSASFNCWRARAQPGPDDVLLGAVHHPNRSGVGAGARCHPCGPPVAWGWQREWQEWTLCSPPVVLCAPVMTAVL